MFIFYKDEDTEVLLNLSNAHEVSKTGTRIKVVFDPRAVTYVPEEGLIDPSSWKEIVRRAVD